MRTGPTNPITRKLIEDLNSQGYKNKSAFMIKLAREIAAPSRARAEVNLSKLNRICNENDVAVVPGRVLSYGILGKPLTVSALSFSKEAEAKIKKAGGKTISVHDLIKTNPKGTNVRLIK